MANMEYVAATNEFKVTDAKRYNEIMQMLSGAEYPIESITKTNDDGTVTCAFGSHSAINCESDDNDDITDMSPFVKELQKILAPDSVFIYKLIYSEKLRDIGAEAIVATKHKSKYIYLDKIILDIEHTFMDD